MFVNASYFTSNSAQTPFWKQNELGYKAALTYVIFSGTWCAFIISNTVHVTICGIFATFYFQGVVGENGKVVVPVKNPTMASASRALTTSFGSIVYGSLILAVIDTIRQLLGMGKQNANQNGSTATSNSFLTTITACFSCGISLLDKFIEFFNVYAFAQVAIYGKPFCSAAKDTWSLIKSRGVDMLINDSIIKSK